MIPWVGYLQAEESQQPLQHRESSETAKEHFEYRLKSPSRKT